MKDHRAELPFFGLLFLGLCAIWGVLAFSYKTIFENKNAVIERQETELNEWRRKFSASTPDEARKRIEEQHLHQEHPEKLKGESENGC